MISSLRRKFVAASMCSVIAVLLIIMGIINVSSYANISKNAQPLLQIILDNGGEFPRLDKQLLDKPSQSRLSPEAPYETRYFSVQLDSSGRLLFTNTGNIKAVDSQTAALLAQSVFSSGKTRGTEGNYAFAVKEQDGNPLVVFLDCRREFDAFKNFALSSLLVSASGILAVFVLVLILSKAVVRPIAESYAKQKLFITDASHEIKTPLTIINANTELLELDTGENQWTSSIKNQVARLTALTEGLVFLSKMDEGGATPPKLDFSLSDAVRETAEPFLALASQSGKVFDLDIPENISYTGDERSLRQLVSVLLDNAVKYSDISGKIVLSLKRQGKNTELSVYNTVSEIEKGKQDTLFERFYRRDSSRSSETGGYGIGLSIAKSIVEAHGGKISAKSADGRSLKITALF